MNIHPFSLLLISILASLSISTSPFRQLTQTTSQCALNNFLYNNGSCFETCTPPLIQSIQNNQKTCNSPCSSTEYLQKDGSCSSACNLPLLVTSEGNYKLCISSLCTEEKPFYYADLSLCKAKCESPNIIKHSGLCVSEAGIASVRMLQASSGFTDFLNNLKGYMIQGMTGAASVLTILSNNPVAFRLVAYINLVTFIKYMNINFPTLLNSVIGPQASSSSSGGFSISTITDKVADMIPIQTFPYNFQRFDLHSSFLVNDIISIAILAVIACVILLVWLVQQMAVHNKKFQNRCKTVIELVWNIFIMVFISNYPTLVLYSSIEFITVHFDLPLEIVSFIICIVLNIFGIVLFVYSIWIVIKFQQVFVKDNRDIKGEHVSEFKSHHKACLVLYDNLNTESKFSQLFMALFIARIYIFTGVIAYLYNFPLVQSVSMVIVCLCMIMYIVVFRPFLLKLDLIQNIFQELIMLIESVCIMVLVINGINGQSDSGTSEFFGGTIVFCIIGFLIVSLAAIAFQTVQYLINMYKARNQTKKVMPIQKHAEEEPHEESPIEPANTDKVDSPCKEKLLKLSGLSMDREDDIHSESNPKINEEAPTQVDQSTISPQSNLDNSSLVASKRSAIKRKRDFTRLLFHVDNTNGVTSSPLESP